MQVTTEQIDPCKIALTITVEPEQVATANDKVYEQFAREIVIPGFRKGKVPAQMARKYIDPDRVRQRAAEDLVGPALVQALEQTEIQPFNGLPPELELVEMSPGGPLVFKAFVPLRPVVTLGPYKGLTLERRQITVSDEDVERQVEELRTRQAEYPAITDRTAQTGDVLFAEIVTRIEGDAENDSEPQSAFIEIGKNLPAFDESIVGVSAGETREIPVSYPEDFADEALRGKTAHFTVTVREMRAKILPEVDDAFVQKVHPTAKTPEEFRTALKENLEKAAILMADNDLEYRIVGNIVDNSQIFFPDALLHNEIQADAEQLQERLKKDNIALEDYLENSGKTIEELQQEMAVAADRRIRNSLVLAEIARHEQLTIDESDVDRVLAERAERAKVSPAAVRALAEKHNQMAQYRDQALTEKLLAFLKEASHVTTRFVTTEELQAENQAPDDAEEEAVEPQGEAGPLAVAGVRTVRRTRKSEDASSSEEDAVSSETTVAAADASDEVTDAREESDAAPSNQSAGSDAAADTPRGE